jgi:hypothetical protein
MNFWPIPVAERSKRRRFAADRLLGLRIRTPMEAWMSVSCDFCALSQVPTADRLPVPRSPTDCDVSAPVIKKPLQSGGPDPRWAVAQEKKKKI